MPEPKLAFPKLGENNYSTWVVDMEAYLLMEEVWYIVTGEENAPTDGTSLDLTKWRNCKGKAAGIILYGLEKPQWNHVKDITKDPTAMWKTLEDVHQKKSQGNHFVAYDTLFSIRKEDNESLASLASRVKDCHETIRKVRPPKFTLDDLDAELMCMSMIRALPEEYKPFVSSLMLLPRLDVHTVEEAFHNHDLHNSPQFLRKSEVAMKAASPVTISPPSGTSSHATAQPLPSQPCNHCTHCCQSPHSARPNSYGPPRNSRGKWKGKKKQQQHPNRNIANQASTPPDNIVEFAGNASIPNNSNLPSHNLFLDTDWNTDTGATSHMTPHRHWFKTYVPLRVPIRLADESVVYSAGVGSVEFSPLIKGKRGKVVEFERVLHVPDLHNNLLSVFYLTKQKGFVVTVNRDSVHFRHNGILMFTATVGPQNTGFLDGHVIPNSEVASIASTCPLDPSLWHRRFSHRNVADVQKTLQEKLVTGIVINSNAKPDPICEPCLAGGQHRGPIPKTASFHAKDVLVLVHSDVKGPLPVRTPEGYRFWVTFIDDMSRFWAVYLLRTKDEVYEAFKRYQAFVETQLGKKIKMFRNDKGGEYISNSFKAHLQKCGIKTQHTQRNEPHQNGIAERANRSLAEGITAILNEAHLPPSFWGYQEPLAICITLIWNTLLQLLGRDSRCQSPPCLWLHCICPCQS